MIQNSFIGFKFPSVQNLKSNIRRVNQNFRKFWKIRWLKNKFLNIVLDPPLEVYRFQFNKETNSKSCRVLVCINLLQPKNLALSVVIYHKAREALFCTWLNQWRERWMLKQKVVIRRKRIWMTGFPLQILGMQTGGTLLSTISPPWLVLVCLVCPLPCLNLDGNTYLISYMSPLFWLNSGLEFIRLKHYTIFCA